MYLRSTRAIATGPVESVAQPVAHFSTAFREPLLLKLHSSNEFIVGAGFLSDNAAFQAAPPARSSGRRMVRRLRTNDDRGAKLTFRLVQKIGQAGGKGQDDKRIACLGEAFGFLFSIWRSFRGLFWRNTG